MLVVAQRRRLARGDEAVFAHSYATSIGNASENASPALSRTSSGPPSRLHSSSPERQHTILLLPSFADEKNGGDERRQGPRQGAISSPHLHASPPSGHISDESPYRRTFLTPGDERTLRIQVRELEGEVASLAEQLHQSQEDLSRANTRNQHLRRTFEEEAEHARTLTSGYEKQLKDDAVEAEKKAHEIFDLKLKLADMQKY